MKKYILFDNDGVLVETEKYYYEANVRALNEFDLELNFDTYMEIMARGGNAWEVAIKAGVPKEEINIKRERRDIYYQELIREKNIEIDGVVETLEKLSHSYKMGIVTTSRRVDFDLVHNNRDIVKYMDFTLCVEEYPRSKPYPDPYLAGMKKFNASKAECIIVEDSQRGLTSAVNAGIECVTVYNEFTKTHDLSKASYKINSIKELTSLLKNL
ncbi:HAD-IA family hydrolase [Sulfurimonas aquatica]|uniref:phosphoglycolate phosphatase n=1 Tax=Sulfurimonas aquatica TaxID=2672570 RepID=A0A975GCT6_9BACT|nr:HAD family phosphatase [Sulfurimonas aquatica]QSZ41648.1 HAD-IA family hydrolase [Sulfurimonas aquatica]